MNTLAGKLLALALCGGIIWAEWRRGYFSRLAPYVQPQGLRGAVTGLGVSAVLAALVLLVDPRLQAAVQRPHAPLVEALIHFGGWLGQGTALWFILAGLYALALILRRADVRTVAVGCLVSAGLSSVLSSLMKWSLARARPNAQLSPWAFFHWSEAVRSRFQSFPSGDTVIVAAAAWYLWSRCPKALLGARVLLLLVPLATACSRVLLNKHWPSDTIFSIGLAFVSARWVVGYEAFSARQRQIME